MSSDNDPDASKAVTGLVYLISALSSGSFHNCSLLQGVSYIPQAYPTPASKPRCRQLCATTRAGLTKRRALTTEEPRRDKGKERLEERDKKSLTDKRKDDRYVACDATYASGPHSVSSPL